MSTLACYAHPRNITVIVELLVLILSPLSKRASVPRARIKLIYHIYDYTVTKLNVWRYK